MNNGIEKELRQDGGEEDEDDDYDEDDDDGNTIVRLGERLEILFRPKSRPITKPELGVSNQPTDKRRDRHWLIEMRERI